MRCDIFVLSKIRTIHKKEGHATSADKSVPVIVLMFQLLMIIMINNDDEEYCIGCPQHVIMKESADKTETISLERGNIRPVICRKRPDGRYGTAAHDNLAQTNLASPRYVNGKRRVGDGTQGGKVRELRVK